MRLQPREYQKQIISSIQTNGNTLVVLPTGLGKTLIALSLIEKTRGKCIFLTPTKPLARQHSNTIEEVLGGVDGGSVLVTGETPPKKRALMYKNRVISSTPQTIRNDMKKGSFPTKDVSLVVFDEAHRAVGEYAYVEIADKLPTTSKIIALTASPGGNKTKIKEVLSNLKIKNIEVRTPSDQDVSKYMKKMEHIRIPIELGEEYLEAKTILTEYIKKQAQLLRNSGIHPQYMSKRVFLALRQKLFSMKNPGKFRLIYLYTCLLHALHIQELLETQGRVPVFKYIQKLKGSPSKSAKTISTSPEIRKIMVLLKTGADHPKMKKLLSLVDEQKGRKMIIFVQYRDQITEIVSELGKLGHTAKPFMGKRDDFTRKMQEETMDAFRKGEFNILVASSIGEEGLDIPEVDSVIFYEPIPSEIRSIQRRGRAGRFKEGSVYVLMTKSTRDEYYYWASRKREKKMKEILLSFQKQFCEGKNPIKNLFSKTKMNTTKKNTTKKKKETKKQEQKSITDFLS